MRPDGGLASKLYEGDNTSGFFGAEWSPNGERLSYIGGHLNKGNLEWSIETRTAKGNPVIVPGTTEIADRTWSTRWPHHLHKGGSGPAFREL